MSTDSSQKNDTAGVVFNTSIKESVPEETPRVVTPQRQAQKIDAPVSHLGGQGVFDVEKAFTSEHADAGTIVSDRRHARRSIGASLMDAWSEWWGKTKSNVEKAIESVPMPVSEEPVTVAAPETRKEVIAEAAHHAIIAPKDDHYVVVENLRTMGSDAKRITGSPITITSPVPDSSKGVWSHHVEETHREKPAEKKSITIPDVRHTAIAPEVTKKITSPVVESFVKNQTKEQVPETLKPTAPQKITVPFTVQKKQSSISQSSVHIAPRIQRDTNPTYSTPIPRPQQSKRAPLFVRETPRTEQKSPRASVPAKEVPSAIPKPLAPAEPKINTLPSHATPPPATSAREVVGEPPVFHGNHSDWALKELSPTHTPATLPSVPHETRTVSPTKKYTPLTWIILGGIVLLGIILAIIASVYINIIREDSVGAMPHVETPAPQSRTEDDTVETITIGDDVESFLSILDTAVGRVKPERTEIRITVIEGATKRIATTEEFLTLLGAHVSPQTLRALEALFVAGSVTTSETAPYFVFYTSNFDTLFSGLLAWENTLYTDFSPLFGTNTITNPLFKDAVVEGRPARILMNDAGFDAVAYGFLNQNTVVITKNREALGKLFLEL